MKNIIEVVVTYNVAMECILDTPFGLCVWGWDMCCLFYPTEATQWGKRVNNRGWVIYCPLTPITLLHNILISLNRSSASLEKKQHILISRASNSDVAPLMFANVATFLEVTTAETNFFKQQEFSIEEFSMPCIIKESVKKETSK